MDTLRLNSVNDLIRFLISSNAISTYSHLFTTGILASVEKRDYVRKSVKWTPKNCERQLEKWRVMHAYAK